MKEVALYVTLCVLVAVVLAKVFPQPCERVKDGLCGKGQYLFYNDLDKPVCGDCPTDTFMDYDSHLCGSCKSRTQPNPGEVLAMTGDSSSDNVIVCSAGFYRKRGTSLELRGQCEQCSVCEDGTWVAHECGLDSDTLCCSKGMVAVQDEEGLECVLPSSKHGRRQSVDGRKVRSPSSQENSPGNDATSSASTDETRSPSSDKPGASFDDKTKDKPQSIPRHSYSSADEEVKPKMVEFPIWGQILCAAIAVAIFLFYLGVGIPCNVCGSLDKLRLLKTAVTRSNNSSQTQEDSKKPMNPKPDAAQV